MYDKIEDTENQLVAARAKKMAIEAEKLTGDNIYQEIYASQMEFAGDASDAEGDGGSEANPS